MPTGTQEQTGNYFCPECCCPFPNSHYDFCPRGIAASVVTTDELDRRLREVERRLGITTQEPNTPATQR